MADRRTTKTIGGLCMWFVLAHWTSCCGFELAVDMTLRFVVEPEDMVAANHSSVVLNCVANSTNASNVEISWRKNGEALVPDGRQYVLFPNGSLLIPRFSQRLNDKEVYECIIKSGSSALVSRQARLQVAVLGNFSGHPQSLVVTEGGNARFECAVDGVPKPTVTWIKNGQPLPQSERFTELPSYVLQIVNVSTSDAGNYFCQSANGFGRKRTSKSAHLTVRSGNRMETIQLLARPKNLEVEVGKTATFECLPSRRPASILWKRKGGLPLPRDRSRILGAGNLEIWQVNTSDAGNYSCEVDGSSALSTEVTLSVIVPARLVSTQPYDSHVRAQTIWMKCEFFGVPRPVITWLKNAQPIRSYGRTRVQGDVLSIGQSADTDSALYQCWAENHAGRAGAVIPLTIKGSGRDPDPPIGLHARAIDSKTIELTWLNPPTNADFDIQGYSVQHWPTLGGVENQAVAKHPPATITALQPHTNYTFYVRAYSNTGASEHSAYVVQATEEDVPLAAPEVHVVPSSATSLMVSWKQLSSFQARGVIVRYKIFYRKHEEPPRDITVPSDVLEYEITELETDQKYSVRVLAATKAGFPRLDEDRWPWVSQIVSKNTRVGVKALPDLKIYALDATTIHMTWSTPEILGTELIGFKVNYNLVGEEPKSIILIETEREHTLYSLKPDSVYEISIGAFTEFNEGELYHQTLRTPAITNPSSNTPPLPPVISEVRPINETAIQLSWVAPPSEVLYYSVSYVSSSTETDKRPREQIIINCTLTHLVISGLRPFTEYSFTVQSHNEAGPGPFSNGVTCHTEEDRPPGLLELTWFLQEPTVVQLNWKVPPHANGIVSQYVVSYCEDRFAADHPWHTHIENGSFCYTVLRGLKSRTAYQVRMHAENRKGAGPASNIRVLTGISPEPAPMETGNSNDRLMGIVIGIGISGGCIVICVIIILLRNRCLSPSRGPPVAMQHANGFTTPLRSNGYVTGPVDDKHTSVHEPDGTTPMLNQPQESDNTNSKTKMPSPKSKQLHSWSSANSRRAGLADKSTTVV